MWFLLFLHLRIFDQLLGNSCQQAEDFDSSTRPWTIVADQETDWHQEKPHLLICRNKFKSALVSRGQADFDWPTGISSSQWSISWQSATWSLIEYLFLFIFHWCFTNPITCGDLWEFLQKDYLRDMGVWKSIREWVYKLLTVFFWLTQSLFPCKNIRNVKR